MGRYAYTMRVTRSGVDEHGAWIMYDVHALGAVSRDHSVSSLRLIRPGIWRDVAEWPYGRWSCCPLYYREFVPVGQTGMLL